MLFWLMMYGLSVAATSNRSLQFVLFELGDLPGRPPFVWIVLAIAWVYIVLVWATPLMRKVLAKKTEVCVQDRVLTMRTETGSWRYRRKDIAQVECVFHKKRCTAARITAKGRCITVYVRPKIMPLVLHLYDPGGYMGLLSTELDLTRQTPEGAAVQRWS